MVMLNDDQLAIGWDDGSIVIWSPNGGQQVKLKDNVGRV